MSIWDKGACECPRAAHLFQGNDTEAFKMVYFLLPCLLWPAEKALQRKQDECANATKPDNYGKAIPKLHPAEAERQGCWNETDVCIYIYIHAYIHTYVFSLQMGLNRASWDGGKTCIMFKTTRRY